MAGHDHKRVDKGGKKIGISSKTHKFTWTSRGGWALYASDTDKPTGTATLIDYDKEFYIVKK